MNVLETKDLKKYYKNGVHTVKALDGISFSVEKGMFLAIVGTSGSGKTTLLNMLGGLDVPDSGSVTVNDKDISQMKPEDLAIFRRRNVGFIFQNYNLVPILNIYDNIALPDRLDGSQPDQDFIRELLELLHMEKYEKFMPAELSGGQQQRAAIARALAGRPQIILADEPTGNLDSHTSGEVLELLKMTSEKYNQTLVMITHSERIAQTADRILHIEDGRIIE